MIESTTMATPAKKKTKSGTANKAAAATKAKAPAKRASKTPTKRSDKSPVRGSGRALLVVESPAKAKTLKKYLGTQFLVQASIGHIKDLPKSKIGVDIEHDFTPHYEVIRGKSKVLAELKKAAQSVDAVYLAPDPDREGEAIAWHLAEELRSANSNIQRVRFHEITPRGVKDAMAQPSQLDVNTYDAQQSRRILDRLVGYQISPLLWNKVKRGLSAGRVQSVAVRIVVEREEEIAAFKPVEYWTIDAILAAKNPPPFPAKLSKIDGKKPPILLGEQARGIVEDLRKLPLVVGNIEQKERRKYPYAPFTTSKLQQDAAHKLRFSAKKTMMLAQRLYEGIDLGKDGAIGLITYMRTDSTRLSPDAVQEVRDYIGKKYGPAYLPKTPIAYKSKKATVQDAHEAIRPTLLKYEPEQVRKLLQASSVSSQDAQDLVKLYQLIWNRFVACQMTPAIYDQTLVDIQAKQYELRASGQVLKDPGFTVVYDVTTEQAPKTQITDAVEAEVDESSTDLPALAVGDVVRLVSLDANQHFTQPPPRFSEATLVKELEEKGIGRPSTYAAILSTIQDREYVEKNEGRFLPTLLGQKVNTLLIQSFPDVLNVEFTAHMEEQLDQVEEGKQEMKQLLHHFYRPFKAELDRASTEMKNLRAEEIPTDVVCEKCGKPMVIKWGRNGEFLACTGYPECKNTKEFVRALDGHVEPKAETKTEEKCSVCGASMVVKRGRFGEFLACSRYPECKHTQPISLGIHCPKPSCDGMLTEKRSKRGAVFYGCTNYSKTHCDFVSWDRPIKQPCPQCNASFLLAKETKRGTKLHCASCTYKNNDIETEEEE